MQRITLAMTHSCANTQPSLAPAKLSWENGKKKRISHLPWESNLHMIQSTKYNNFGGSPYSS